MASDSGGTDADGLLIKFNSNGDEVWSTVIGAAGFDWFGSAQETSDGNFVVAGYSGSYGPGNADAWLLFLVLFPGYHSRVSTKRHFK